MSQCLWIVCEFPRSRCVSKITIELFSQSANRWKMQNFDQIVNERYQKKWFILCFTKKLRDFEIISVSSLFRFNYNIINLLFLKSYFIINSAYLNAQIIWNDMKNEIKYRRRNVSFISLYFFFFFFFKFKRLQFCFVAKKRKRYWNWRNKLLNEFIINITI